MVGPYWAKELGKSELKAQQLSRRVGDLWVTVKTDAQRVVVAGNAVAVLEGHFLL